MSSNKAYLFNHNVKAYTEMEDYLRKDNKAIVILGTGVGKTTTALEYCARHDCRALVICPTKLIKNSWDKNKEFVDTITYSSFSKKYMDIDYSEYGVVICDEIHHGGADTWGKGIKYIIDNKITKVIGLTATNIRSDGIDVANTLFGGNICRGLTVLEGINAGILYPFSYVGAYYDASKVCEEIKEQYGDKLSEKLIGDLDNSLNNTPTVRDIILKNIPNGKRKGIIFVENINEIESGIALVKSSFPDAKYRYIHSEMAQEDIKKNKRWFENTDEGFLCSVNMISEGAHYNGVNTLFMLRRTSSPLVFEQQLGRVITLTAKNNPNAIVFDFVNNSKTIQDFKVRIEEVINNFEDSDEDDKNNTDFIDNVDDFDLSGDLTTDIIDTFDNNDNKDNLKDESDKINTGFDLTDDMDDEDENIHTDSSSSGNNPFDKKSCQIIFQDYTVDINEVLQNIKDIYDVKLWSEEEDNIIKKYYPIEGKDVIKRLNNRNESSCRNRAKILGIKSNSHSTAWTEKEDKILKKYYPIEGLKVKRRLKSKRSNRAIQVRASYLKLNKQKEWTKNEDEILKKYYITKGLKVKELLENDRTEKAISRRAQLLGLKKKLKKVKCIELNKTFNSILEAANFTNAQSSSITNCLKRRQKTANGYHWEYVEE